MHFCKSKKVIIFFLIFTFGMWGGCVAVISPGFGLLKICLFQGEEIVVETKQN